MKLPDYQKFVRAMWTPKKRILKLKDYFIMTAGLGGETGEVLEILKKSVRDDEFDKNHLIEELGDVLYYLTMVCNYHKIKLEDVMEGNVEKLEKRYNRKIT